MRCSDITVMVGVGHINNLDRYGPQMIFQFGCLLFARDTNFLPLLFLLARWWLGVWARVKVIFVKCHMLLYGVPLFKRLYELSLLVNLPTFFCFTPILLKCLDVFTAIFLGMHTQWQAYHGVTKIWFIFFLFKYNEDLRAGPQISLPLLPNREDQQKVNGSRKTPEVCKGLALTRS